MHAASLRQASTIVATLGTLTQNCFITYPGSLSILQTPSYKQGSFSKLPVDVCTYMVYTACMCLEAELRQHICMIFCTAEFRQCQKNKNLAYTVLVSQCNQESNPLGC